MIDFEELMRILSVPRPNGSAAERARALAGWLEQRGIPCRRQPFTLYPHYFEAIGAWFILSRGLLALAVWLRWGWPALAIAVIAVLGGTLDKVLLWPVVTWPGKRSGLNLIAEFDPLTAPAAGVTGEGPSAGAAGETPPREMILSAHYDSKTELLDHTQRVFFLRRLPLSLALTLAVGLLGVGDGRLQTAAPAYAGVAFVLAAVLALPMLFLAWGLGGYLALGRLAAPSQGAVDNGAACAVLLGLAQGLHCGDLALRHTRVTIALFGGEEVNMQGSRAYVRSRPGPAAPPLLSEASPWDRSSAPIAALNLEILGQNGGYLRFAADGDAVRRRATDPELNRLLAAAVTQVTGQAPLLMPALSSDGFSFLAAGIPTAVLGSYDRRLHASGLHSRADNLGRVDLARLPEAVAVLRTFLAAYDSL